MEIRLVPNLAALWDEILLLCASSEGLASRKLLKFIPVKKADDILKDLPEEDMEIQIYHEICKALLTAQPFEMSKLPKNSLFELQMDIHNYLIDLQNKSQKANPIAIKDEIQKKYQNRLISIRARQQIRKVFEKNEPEPIRQDCLQAEGL